MTSPVIAVIGSGNMGSSLIGGLIKDGHPPDTLWATDPSQEKLETIKQTFKVHTTPDNSKAVLAADIVIFAIKPQFFDQVLAGIKETIQTHKPLLITIAAGIRIASIEHRLGNNLSIVRAMPNTPALIGKGAAALFANPHVSEKERHLAESILRAVGIVVWVNDEKLMDTVTALSGSGPAYFFLVMEAMQEVGEELGLTSETARLLTLQTALGAASMALESDLPLNKLREQVTSKGGTTEKAISVLEENNIREIFKHALRSAKTRSEELAELLGATK